MEYLSHTHTLSHTIKTIRIVPYIRHGVTGSVAGVIGAGGNVGGVVFSVVFGEYDYSTSFVIMGIATMAGATLSFLFMARGHAGLLCGEDSDEVVLRRTNHTESFGNIPQISTRDNNRLESRRIDDLVGQSAAEAEGSSNHSTQVSLESKSAARSHCTPQ